MSELLRLIMHDHRNGTLDRGLDTDRQGVSEEADEPHTVEA